MTSEPLSARAESSLRYFRAIMETIDGAGINTGEDRRTEYGHALLTGGLELCFEIAHLVNKGRHIPAMALLRPSFEFTTRGLWLLFAATDEDADHFVLNDSVTVEGDRTTSINVIRLFRMVMASLPPELAVDATVWEWFRRDGDQYKMMCSYSHGGVRPAQLVINSIHPSRRLDHQDACAILGSVDYTATLAAAMICIRAGKGEAAEAVAELYIATLTHAS